MQLANNFFLHEFEINKFATAKDQERISGDLTEAVIENLRELAKNLQVLRDYLKGDKFPKGPTITITIGFRPKWWEEARGRSGKSQHVTGKAADFVVEGHTPKKVAEAIDHLISTGKMKQGGLKAYKTFTHYDIRGTRARW